MQGTLDPSKLYPYVFDSLASAKLSSAFVAGAKVNSHLKMCLGVMMWTCSYLLSLPRICYSY